MIKLIATDLDGTLLNDQKQLPIDFWQTVTKLKQKEIIFVAASGRTLQTLKQDFSQDKESIAFVASNGAVVEFNNEIIYKKPIIKSLVHKIFKQCEQYPEAHLAVSSEKATYMLSLDGKLWHKDLISKSFGKITFVDNLYDIKDDILQIAVSIENNLETTCYPYMHNLFSSELEVVLSGEWWLDFMCMGTSKGSALAILQQKLAISRSETMAFGDYNNDITLLQQAGESYVMQNAPIHMQKYAKHLAPSNNDNGVMAVIQNTVFLQDYISLLYSILK